MHIILLNHIYHFSASSSYSKKFMITINLYRIFFSCLKRNCCIMINNNNNKQLWFVDLKKNRAASRLKFPMRRTFLSERNPPAQVSVSVACQPSASRYQTSAQLAKCHDIAELVTGFYHASRVSRRVAKSYCSVYRDLDIF